jgi:hypothetical protein
MLAAQEELRECLSGIRSPVLTGSGSSEYAGECVRLPIQKRLYRDDFDALLPESTREFRGRMFVGNQPPDPFEWTDL